MTSAIAVRGLKKRFDHEVLAGVDLEVEPGETVAIIGPSGGGKSTLLRCMNLLERPDEGELLVDGALVPYHNLGEDALSGHRARVGMVFQHFHLFAHLDVLANVVEAPIRVAGVAQREAETVARALLARVGLEGREGAMPHELSGGQKQRVAIARALAMRPQILLLDEVTSALDVEVVKDINRLLIDIARDGMTMIAVTHDLAFARAFAERVVFMDAGRVVESGDTSILDRPSSPRLNTFLAAVS